MSDIVSLVKGEAFSQIIDWSKACITDLAAQMKIDKLIQETAKRGAMTPYSNVLTEKFSNTAS